MGAIEVRPATVADAAAITAIHCSHVDVWRRDGRGAEVGYDALSPYERWLHGGPWMSVETCRAHLEQVLAQGWTVLVAQEEGEVVGAAEFLENREPAPYGPALHLSLLFVRADRQGQGAGRALVEVGVRAAQEQRCVALTTQPERPAEPFYRRAGFAPWLSLREWQARAQGDLGALEIEPVTDAPYPAGAGVALRVGRYQCARQAWDDLDRRLPPPELTGLPWGRWRVTWPDGALAWLAVRTQPLDPAQADGYAWARPDVDLGRLVMALQGLAGRLGFAWVDLLLEEPEGSDLAASASLGFQTDLTLWRRDMIGAKK